MEWWNREHDNTHTINYAKSACSHGLQDGAGLLESPGTPESTSISDAISVGITEFTEFTASRTGVGFQTNRRAKSIRGAYVDFCCQYSCGGELLSTVWADQLEGERKECWKQRPAVTLNGIKNHASICLAKGWPQKMQIKRWTLPPRQQRPSRPVPPFEIPQLSLSSLLLPILQRLHPLSVFSFERS